MASKTAGFLLQGLGQMGTAWTQGIMAEQAAEKQDNRRFELERRALEHKSDLESKALARREAAMLQAEQRKYANDQSMATQAHGFDMELADKKITADNERASLDRQSKENLAFLSAQGKNAKESSTNDTKNAEFIRGVLVKNGAPDDAKTLETATMMAFDRDPQTIQTNILTALARGGTVTSNNLSKAATVASEIAKISTDSEALNKMVDERKAKEAEDSKGFFSGWFGDDAQPQTALGQQLADTQQFKVGSDTITGAEIKATAANRKISPQKVIEMLQAQPVQ